MIAVSKAEWVAVTFVPVLLSRFQYRWIHPSKLPFSWWLSQQLYGVAPASSGCSTLCMHHWIMNTWNWPEGFPSSNYNERTKTAGRNWLCHSSLYLPCIYWRSIEDGDLIARLEWGTASWEETSLCFSVFIDPIQYYNNSIDRLPCGYLYHSSHWIGKSMNAFRPCCHHWGGRLSMIHASTHGHFWTNTWRKTRKLIAGSDLWHFTWKFEPLI